MPTNDDSITLTVQLPNGDVAWQLAQFCKRISFNAAFELTEAHLSCDERTRLAYQMLAGMDAVARALADAGHSPR